MPITACEMDGRPGFKWGASGKCYTYDPASPSDRKQARSLAERQARAILATDAGEIEPVAPEAPKRVQRQNPPVTWERRYFRAMQDTVLKALRQEAERMVRALRPELPEPVTTDAEEWRQIVEAFTEQIEIAGASAGSTIRLGALFDGVERYAVGAVNGVFRRSVDRPKAERFIRLMDVAANETRAAELADFTAENLRLIRKVSRESAESITDEVSQAILRGDRVEEIQRVVQKRLKVSESDAARIARDQVGKLNSRIQADRMREARVTQYRWRTSRDSRVRDDHAELEGQLFDMDGPGAPGAGPYGESAHPGEAIQCRCIREPIIPEVDEDELDRLIAARVRG